MTRRSAIISLLLIMTAMPADAQPLRLAWDAVNESRVRRLDTGADGPLDAALHAKPDLVGYQIGRWSPTVPVADLYTGTWNNAGGFLRFDIGLAGFVNPPGPLAQYEDNYDPFLYGPNPVFGYIEFDVDNRVTTGGEIDFPNLRYLANAGRFGGMPATPRFANRVPLVPEDFDNDAASPPLYERSGEDFHLALFGDKITNIIKEAGDLDTSFEPGEKWIVRGRLFHRSHAFERFSTASGTGAYEPLVDLLFEYHAPINTTIISLVFPLTNTYAAQLANSPAQPIEPNDGSSLNQSSIEEALVDVILNSNQVVAGGPLTNDPQFEFMRGWSGSSAADYLDPQAWDVMIVVGMAYVSPQAPGELYAPTDIMDDPVIGDFDGDGIVTCGDEALHAEYIASHETPGVVGFDGEVDGIVHIAGFGPVFSVFDLNYDGATGPADADAIVIRGDLDDDCDVDFDDLALFVQFLVSPEAFGGVDTELVLERADFNRDGLLNGADVSGFASRLLAE